MNVNLLIDSIVRQTPGGPAEPSDSSVPLGCASRRFQVPEGEAFAAGDATNLRCFRQKRHFGVDYLYPVERYRRALTQPKIPAPICSKKVNDSNASDFGYLPATNAFVERITPVLKK